MDIFLLLVWLLTGITHEGPDGFPTVTDAGISSDGMDPV